MMRRPHSLHVEEAGPEVLTVRDHLRVPPGAGVCPRVRRGPLAVGSVDAVEARGFRPRPIVARRPSGPGTRCLRGAGRPRLCCGVHPLRRLHRPLGARNLRRFVGHDPEPGLDSADRPHIAWLRDVNLDDGLSVMHSRLTEVGWTSPRWVDSGPYDRISLSIDGSGPTAHPRGRRGRHGVPAEEREGGARSIDPDVRVDALSLRASSSGTIAVWAGRSASDPRGVYLSRD